MRLKGIEAAAAEAGCSLRHFRRLLTKLGLKGSNLSTHGRKHLKYTDVQIEKVKAEFKGAKC